MRVEFETGKEDGRRQFGVKLLGAVISVALLVAVAMAVGGSENSASSRVGTKGLYVGSGKIDMDAIEREVFESTGLRVKVVQAHELAALGRKKMMKGDDWSDAWGTYSFKSINANRYLSSVRGKDKSLITENSVQSETEKWDVQVDPDVPKFRFFKDGTTNRCIKMNSSGDVKLENDCGGDNAKFLLLRTDSNTHPMSNYDDNKFLMYRYGGKQKYIIVSAAGSVSASDDPVTDSRGLFEFSSV